MMAPMKKGPLYLAPGMAALFSLACTESRILVNSDKEVGVAQTAKDKGSDKPKIPADFPRDIPVYRNVTSVAAIRGDGVRSLHLTSKDPRSAIRAFYRKELAAGGWRVAEAKSTGKNDVILGRKEERTVSVSIMDMGSDRTIRIVPMEQ
jgi:hypothetical protein